MAHRGKTYLAARAQVSFRQLWDEPFVAAPEETGVWRDYHLATAERQGHPPRIGYVTSQPDGVRLRARTAASGPRSSRTGHWLHVRTRRPESTRVIPRTSLR